MTEAAAEHFRERSYVVAPDLIDARLAHFFWSFVHTNFASLALCPGGPVAPDSLGGYGDATFHGLLEYLRPGVEERCGLRLHPTYSSFRLHRRGNALPRHRDRRGPVQIRSSTGAGR
jgi:hypothetical protein